MGGENKFIRNLGNILDGVEPIKTVQIGVVADITDPLSLGRIKIRIPGQANKGGDDGTIIQDLPWAYPLLPKFFSSIPKVGEAVFVMVFNNQRTHGDRLYLGPIISQLNKLEIDRASETALNSFNFPTTKASVSFDTIPSLNGVFPKKDDISIQGRYNTDILLRKNEILIRAGKFVSSTPNENNPYPFEFNRETQGYIQIKNDVQLNIQNETPFKGTVVNVVGNKINLITHKDGLPRFNVLNQDNQISDDEIIKILEQAHPLPFGDTLLEYLILLKNAFLNHVHNYNGMKPTDITTGTGLPVQDFNKKAEGLENIMLSKNIHIN
jgi:hypothetical protein